MSNYMEEQQRAERASRRDEYLEQQAAEKAAEHTARWARIERAALAIATSAYADGSDTVSPTWTIREAKALIDEIDRQKAQKGQE